MQVLSSLGAQPLPERSPSQRGVLQWLARCLHMQLFAVVYAASEPELGIAHAVAMSYVVVWAVARHTMLSHGARCRLDTSLCYALIAFLNVRPMAERGDAGGSLSTAGFIVSVLVVAVLPSWSLWWPPKRGGQEQIFAQLEAFVRSNLAMLAQRHAERPPHGGGDFTIPLEYHAEETRGAGPLLPVFEAYEPEHASAQCGGARPRRRDLGTCGERGRSATSSPSSIQQRRSEGRRRCSSAGRARFNGGGA
jgi:hypothetical protein